MPEAVTQIGCAGHPWRRNVFYSRQARKTTRKSTPAPLLGFRSGALVHVGVPMVVEVKVLFLAMVGDNEHHSRSRPHGKMRCHPEILGSWDGFLFQLKMCAGLHLCEEAGDPYRMRD